MPRYKKIESVFDFRDRKVYREIILAFLLLQERLDEIKIIHLAVLLLNSEKLELTDRRYRKATEEIIDNKNIFKFRFSPPADLEEKYLKPIRKEKGFPINGLRDPHDKKYLNYYDLHHNYLGILQKYGLIQKSSKKGVYQLGNRDLRAYARQWDINQLNNYNLDEISTYTEIGFGRRGSGIFSLYGLNFDNFQDQKDEIRGQMNVILAAHRKIQAIAMKKFEEVWNLQRDEFEDGLFREFIKLPDNPSLCESLLNPPKNFNDLTIRISSHALGFIATVSHSLILMEKDIEDQIINHYGSYANMLLEKFLPIIKDYWPKNVVSVVSPRL